MLRGILTFVFVAICVFLTVVVLLQEGKSAGLSGTINGMADSYWGRNKLTKYGAILWLILALVLNLKVF